MKISERLKNVRMLVLDVDGVLTDNKIFLSDSGQWRRSFSIRDGYGMVRLREAGLLLGILSGSNAEDIQERAKVLGVHFVSTGKLDKVPGFEEMLSKSGLGQEQVAYMGDDFFDLPVLRRVGFAATVGDALDEVKKECHYVAKALGGAGGVREICELILSHQEKALSGR